MNTNMNYPVKPTRNSWQKIYDWFCNVIKTNRLISLVILVVVLALFVSLMIKYSWALWGYVVSSLLLIVGLGLWLLFTEYPKNDIGAGSEQITDNHEKDLNDLRTQNLSLNNRIVNLENVIRDKDAEIIQLKLRLGEIEKEYTLENRYADILILLQNLNICVEDLSTYNAEFVNVTKNEISGVLSLYGYVFKDYDQDAEMYYDCEEYDIEMPQTVRRAIVNKKGELIVKGKIYIPNEYGR